MTVEEALEVLGLELGADAEAIKRAYHKRLKTTKPDRDPEGFKRLRAAFELATAFSDGGDLLAALVAERLEDVTAVEPEPSSSPEPAPRTSVEVVRDALEHGRIDEALEIVTAPQWATVLLDDFDGSATHVTSSVAKVAILARPSAFDELQARHPDLVEATDVEMGLLLVIRRDWEHLLAHCELPKPLFDIIVQNPVVVGERRRSLARALGRWYWRDPAAAWDVLIAILRNHGALGPYVFGLLDDYEDLVEDPASVSVDTDATPREVLRPLTTPFAILAFSTATAVLVLAMPDDPSDTSMLGIVARHFGALFAGMLVLWLEALAYRMWPSIRRRFVHACLVHDLLPEDAAWAISGHVFLQRAVARDLLVLLCHRVARLGAG
ncbi:MAG: hypothetical protein ACE37F_30315 [Nannocystaceae bacterium]